VITVTLAEIATWVDGQMAEAGEGDRTVHGVSIDSRAAERGTLFVPLRGEHTDGHEFVGDAVARGAAGYFWEERRDLPAEPGAVLVTDPAAALLELGGRVRDLVDPTVVAVTGSNGKTTTKDLIAAAAGTRRRVVANPGSYNNELGVPLTCCLLAEDSEVLVAEVGARGVGHIARLTPLLRPDIAVVTMVGAAHLELLGSLDTVATAKRELVEGLGPDGVAVLNADDPRVAAMREAAPGTVVTYGMGEGADWRGEQVELDDRGRARFRVRGVAVRLPMAGAHNAGNALAALAVADLLGVPTEDAAAGLAEAVVSRWRMELVLGAGGVTVLNDAYNANPTSTAAALRTLAAMRVPGERWAVLGYMAELGTGEVEAHEGIGRLCAELGLDGLVVVGPAARPIASGARGAGFSGRLVTVEEVDAVLGEVRGRLGVGDAVLVKASRAVGLERVAQQLVERAGVA
jgi:UDP-N-acetylmuramoyl-tripeptide--D-alanyl-D-alanine ligase